MEHIVSVLNEIRNINNEYKLPIEDIDRIENEMGETKVCTPIIGKFSTGKSAVLNELLRYRKRMLKEDITPETAIPVEIVYTEDEERVLINMNNGEWKEIKAREYRNYEADTTTVKNAVLQLNNEFLEKIPDVMLVDMPGFESGFEIHNKAIDEYLPKSLAYMIAFPADDMIVRSNIGNILKELCIYDMPISIVITKYDKRSDDFDEGLEHLKNSLKRYIGDREVRCCITSSFDGEIKELEDFLYDVQEDSVAILNKKFKVEASKIIDNTEKYLNTLAGNSELTHSELEEKKDKLNQELENLEEKINKDQQQFDKDIVECIEGIRMDIERMLSKEKEGLVVRIINGQDIEEHLNSCIRETVANSVQERFISCVQKYIKKVESTISADAIENVHISLDAQKFKSNTKATVAAVVASLFVGGPILGILAGVFMKALNDKKREEAKQKARDKLTKDTYPRLLSEVGSKVEQAIHKEADMIKTTINIEINNQRNLYLKAIEELQEQISKEQQEKENYQAKINDDLAKIGELRYELR